MSSLLKKSATLRSGLIMGAAQPLGFLIQLCFSIALARLLTPEDFGLVLMVTAITNFALTFRDLGLGTVTIQSPTLSAQQTSDLFWINVVVGLILSALVCALAWPISWLYKDPRLAAITLATAPVFLASGLSVQHSALLRRDLRFGPVVAVDMTSAVLAGGLAVLLAWATRSYWSIVVWNVARPSFNMLLLWTVNRWRPVRFTGLQNTRSLIARGANVAGHDIINYWSRNIDKVLVGRFFGAELLGLYKKAYELLLLPIAQLRAPITAVALPSLSRHQDRPEQLAQRFLGLISVLAFGSSLLIAGMLLVDDLLIPALLGPAWRPVVDMFSRLAPAAVIQSIVGPLGVLLLSTSQNHRYLRWGLGQAFVMVGSFVIGAYLGLYELITCYVVANAIAFLPSVVYCTRHTQVRVGSFLVRALGPISWVWLVFWGVQTVGLPLLQSRIGTLPATIACAAVFVALSLAYPIMLRGQFPYLNAFWDSIRSRKTTSPGVLRNQ